ncbi:BnaC04g53080D [Brassica napus]|uniref:DUF4005 domain-containing protein n=4 Tax=Brassica TaxID=3705 RepID=A0A0D3BPL5_BRAOL|nr:PREDICTED: protein IQ-DOMAIN 14-like [Brassica oleracea var. oleracea]XP_013636591.1 PREDICTED: protein IQ-DOMAIN 14-like [Brassica oleracea var. oleracea]XP_013636592.1 PREDICTED: protein IQ-DOMAIN 14-like [Brassica oleracea var. oleracea]XP_013636593.1 PREDICTED: protein IQ-DOMAIN 14-like [Brassica oleracea var. oleracea]XP_013636594.1 PREDICTED: protein IQ-DOMAIN 14-like [Brassica oleracea var. oleracea]XP_013636595.1 PREDICTED: protein IQ-DOMAIN 14-like [Brassica oleracea var. oleracea]
MGKKGSWFSAIKRVFTPHSKEKLGNEGERKNVKEKRKKGFGKLRRGEPSSIEKIFGEAERDHNLFFRPSTPPPDPDRSNPPSYSPPPPLRPASPQLPSPKPHPPPRADLPRLDPPRPPDLSASSSASASAPPPPLKPASTRVPSQRINPPIVPSPRPTSPRVVSQQAVPQKLPSPRADSLRLNNPRPSSPKPPSPRADSPRLNTPRPPSPGAEPPTLDAPRPITPRPPSPRPVSPRPVQRREIVPRPEPTLLVQHASATKIQAAFRAYMARRSFRALKGLVRLQGVVRGHSVKRQTINAMKYMQQLVRVQSQIQSRRIKTLENKAQAERDEAKWAAASDAGNGNWDDSVLTKEERDARSQRKTDAVIKRERSMAYAYSHKLWKNSPKSAASTGGLPLWWNWMDWQLPLASPAPSYRDYRLTPTRLSPSPLSHHFRHDSNFDTSTPKSSRSTLLTPSRPIRTGTSRYSRGRGQDSPFTDNDSLTSCPPFPSYMAPTVSARAKVRPSSNPKERVMGTPSSVSSERRRMSYPPTQQGMDTFRWNKGSLVMSNSSGQRGGGGPSSPGGVVLEKHKTLKSVGNLSIGSSTVSMADGRKRFNRYV